MHQAASLSPRAYSSFRAASSWEELWEAGSYYDRVSELMEKAHESIAIVGWQIDSRLPLKGPERADGGFAGYETLKQKLIRLCEAKPQLQIYILMWDHAWFYVYEREVWQGRIWENIHPRVHFVFDGRHPLGASHHEKICLFDGRIALCGGIDLCDERWDSNAHLYQDRRRSLSMEREHHGPYHDLAVQVSGPICREIHQHIAERWEYLSTIPFAPVSKELRHPSIEPRSSGEHAVYFSRTSARIDLKRGEPHAIREIEFLFRDLIDSAQKRLILEGQYYWSKEINDLLIRKIRKMRGKDFEIILVLADLRRAKSLTRLMSQYEFRLLERLSRAAQAWGAKVRIGMPYSYWSVDPSDARARPPRSIYVHSKTLIVDDRYLAIGSANFAARALRLDSEICLTLQARSAAERRHIDRFAGKLVAHWNTRSIELRPLNPGLLLECGRAAGRWFDPPAPNYTWIPWERFFDPEMSPLYPLKRAFLRWKLDKRPVPRTAAKLLYTIGLSALASTLDPRALIYCFLLCSSWILPIPFLLVALIASIDSGLTADQAIHFSVLSFWFASLSGYLAARMFPTRAQKVFERDGGGIHRQEIIQRLGQRFFPRFLLAAFDPAIPLRDKAAYEGLFCMPLPWFVLTNFLVLPSVLYGLLAGWNRVWFWYAPRGWISAFSESDPLRWSVLLVIFTLSLPNLRLKRCREY